MSKAYQTFPWPKDLQGRLMPLVSMASMTWLGVGGQASWVYHPHDPDDLARVLRLWPRNYPVYVLGAGSNLLVRDGGLDGLVIKLGRGFRQFVRQTEGLFLGAGLLNRYVTQQCQVLGLGGLDFMNTIPGTIGGGLAMNAGCYGSCFADHVVWARVMDPQGNVCDLSVSDLGYGYRTCQLAPGWLFLGALFRVSPEDPLAIAERMNLFSAHRENTQPLQVKTGGSTFANPPQASAWSLIDAAGFRGQVLGDAQFSDKHCNFLINRGAATAWQLETLAERARQSVKELSGIDLHWEIVRWGNQGSDQAIDCGH
jgi:UDP-N-acetylmuramate dehydrogenase